MANSNPIHELVAANFGPVAAKYATSRDHDNKDALDQLVGFVSPLPTDELLDIATGAGNVALAFAPHVARVVAFDLTPSMLEQTLKTAAIRGLANVEAVQGLAEDLPFDDGSFDVVTVRLAPHHYADIQKAVDEMARVVRVGGKVAIVDTTVPEDDTLDREINEIETLRDNSHIRNYRPNEWRAMFEKAGLSVIFERVGRVSDGHKMDFDEWVERIRTPEPEINELRRRFHDASPALVEAIHLERMGEKISFVWDQVTLVATK
jgi:ubiquinone/menaquinone biosynthesis C-methylase UbiE